MRTLGIERNQLLVYEGDSTWGHAVWPMPVIIPVHIIDVDSSIPDLNNSIYHIPYIFREDSYDPVSRVRRGSLYISNQSQPTHWQVYPHPAVEVEHKDTNNVGVLTKELFTFHSFNIRSELKRIEISDPLFILGTNDNYTIWTLVNTESSALGGSLVYLRARQSFGSLPKILVNMIPENGRDQVAAALESLSEDIYRAVPASVVDRCRNAVTTILSIHLQNEGTSKPGKDLGGLVNILIGEKGEKLKRIVIGSSTIINIFHSRGKNSEQERRQLRTVTERDAELSVMCVGAVLCELGWAV